MANPPPLITPKLLRLCLLLFVMAVKLLPNKALKTQGVQSCFQFPGHVERPGNYEVPLGTPFAKLLEMAGGMKDGKKLKAVIPGGLLRLYCLPIL